MWGNTLIIDRLIPPVSLEELQGKEEDKLVLAWEQRRWMRGRFTTAKGRKIGSRAADGNHARARRNFVGWARLVLESRSRHRAGAGNCPVRIRRGSQDCIRGWQPAFPSRHAGQQDSGAGRQGDGSLDGPAGRAVGTPAGRVQSDWKYASAINMDNFLSLLQFADGLFPAGAYAHSFGLEYLRSIRRSGRCGGSGKFSSRVS